MGSRHAIRSYSSIFFYLQVKRKKNCQICEIFLARVLGVKHKLWIYISYSSTYTTTDTKTIVRRLINFRCARCIDDLRLRNCGIDQWHLGGSLCSIENQCRISGSRGIVGFMIVARWWPYHFMSSAHSHWQLVTRETFIIEKRLRVSRRRMMKVMRMLIVVVRDGRWMVAMIATRRCLKTFVRPEILVKMVVETRRCVGLIWQKNKIFYSEIFKISTFNI